MSKKFTFILLFICFSFSCVSQGKFVIQNKKQIDKIKFKLINNLIVIPVEVNGVTLSFLLDTGVSKPIIFNFLNVSDTLEIRDTETIYLRGLGGGDSVEALKSKNNIFKIGDAIKLNQDLYVVYNKKLNFALRLGVPVHGVIGLDLFKDFIVEINYSKEFLRIIAPGVYRYKSCKKCERFALEFYNGKPYLNAIVEIEENKIPVKLLIDSGSSDALWLFEDDSLGIKSSDKYFNDFLGHGLNGSVYGKRSKIKAVSLNGYQIENSNVAFPNTENVFFAKQIKNRNGSIAGNILKRFNITFDYKRAIMTLKKNGLFKENFSYNKSGIELAHDGVRFVRELKNKSIKGYTEAQTNTSNSVILDTQYKVSLKPAYAIVELRAGSPAEKAGLQIGDVILTINGKNTHVYSLQQITKMFYDYHGKKIKLKIDRGGFVRNYDFLLQRPF